MRCLPSSLVGWLIEPVLERKRKRMNDPSRKVGEARRNRQMTRDVINVGTYACMQPSNPGYSQDPKNGRSRHAPNKVRTPPRTSQRLGF